MHFIFSYDKNKKTSLIAGIYELEVKSKKSNEIFAYTSLILAMLLYGSTFLAMKVVLNNYSPIEMIAIRMVMATLLFLPFLFTTYKNIRVEKSDFGILFLMILAEPCLYFIFEGYALKNTTSSQAGIVNALEPVFITIGAAFILKEKMPKVAYLGFIIAIIGSVFLSISAQATESAPNPILGNFLECVAIILAALSIIATKYLMDKYPPFYLAGCQIIGGAIFFVLLSFLLYGNLSFHFGLSFLILIYLALLTVVTYALYNYSMCSLSASKASPFLYLMPVFAMLFGWFFLDELLTKGQIIACFVIFFGIYLTQTNYKRKLVKIRKHVRKLNK